MGAFSGIISAPDPTGLIMSTAQKIYVVSGTNDFFLSCSAMVALDIIGKDFPRAGASKATAAATTAGGKANNKTLPTCE